MSEDEFEPQLGRQKARGAGKKGRKYLGRVIAAVALTGGVSKGRNRRFDGSRIGRGASMGRLLSSRAALAGQRGRRVTIKTRLVRLGGKGLAGATAHLRYIQRDGVTRDGAPGTLYSAERDQADGKAFLERGNGDRHQFRFIVSAEDGAEYQDLKPMVRRVMTQMEADLGTRLDWVAVDHFNTGHPHTHIMLRGVDDRGQNLVIAKEYISHGMRARAAELVTLDLGPRTDQDIEARLRQDIGAERLTATDRQLRGMDGERIVSIAARDPLQQSLRAGRLQALGQMGLAEHQGQGRWQLAESIEPTLRAMGERGDIIRTLQRELGARRLDRPARDRHIYDPSDGQAPPLVGRVVMRGLADEHRDRHYLIVDGVDGRTHYVGIGRGDAVEPMPEGAIVRIAPLTGGIREVDRTVAHVAAANGGRYSVDLHLRHDSNASEAFADTHVRRLEAIRRTTGGAERQADGSWTIAPDHLARVEAYEARVARDRPVTIETLSSVPLPQLPRADAATWLDRLETGNDPTPVRAAGFGQEVKAAQDVRRQWLVEQELAGPQAGGGIRVAGNLMAALQRRELLRVAGEVSGELGKPFVETRSGERIEGVLKRRLDLVSGRFALVEKSREFTLVPWKPTLERQLGSPVSGLMRGDGVNWSLGRGRGGPVIG